MKQNFHRPQSRFLLIPFLILISVCLYSADVYHDGFSWSLNLTETWELFDDDYENGITSFIDQEGLAFFQVIVSDPDKNGDNAVERGRQLLSSLQASGDIAPFLFSGHEAALIDASWTTGSASVRGYLVVIDDKAVSAGALPYNRDYVLLAFALESDFDRYHDFLLSNLDSFSPIEDEYSLPGAVSQFIRHSGGSSLRTDILGRGRGNELPPLSRSPNELQPMQGLPIRIGSTAEVEAAYAGIERESRILQQYANAPREIAVMAWRRYYQMLYKDAFYDMAETARIIDGRLEAHGVIRSEYPSEILAWLQGFGYQRAGGLSDFEPAWICIANESGDCDSLALIFMSILNHLGFDSLLMISDMHAHALVGVDTLGPGARFEFDGTRWLVSELTADVPIGMIASEHADPADWMPFDLSFRPEW